MQKYVVIARLDETTDTLFNQWKIKAYNLQSIQYLNATSWPPHITIAAYENIDVNDLCSWVFEYTKDLYEIDVYFSSLGVFAHGKNLDTDVIYVNPNSTVNLTEFYYNFHKKFDEYCGNYGKDYILKSENLTFHSTITICKKEDFNKIFDRLRDDFNVVRGKIIALEVYKNPMELINRYELNSLENHSLSNFKI